MGKVGWIFEEHCPDQRLARYGFVRVGITVGQQHRLELEIRPVDAGSRFTHLHGIFGTGAPAVHIQLHGRKSLPLEVAHIHCHIPSAEDAVHVTGDVSHSRQSGTDIGGNMESDIFPVSSCLVTCPDTGISLRSCPTVHRDDKRAGVTAVIRHDLCHIGNAVEAERIA